MNVSEGAPNLGRLLRGIGARRQTTKEELGQRLEHIKPQRAMSMGEEEISEESSENETSWEESEENKDEATNFRKVIKILQKESNERKEEDLDFLHEALGGKDMFTKLSKDTDHPIEISDELVRLCWKAVHHRSYPRRREIIKYGEVGEEYYILLAGKVEVKIPVDEDMQFSSKAKLEEFERIPNNSVLSIQEKYLNKENKEEAKLLEELFKNNKLLYRVKYLKKVVELPKGAGFGELALINNKKRAATIVTVTPCHVAYLNKFDFRRILGGIMQKEQLENLRIVRQFPIIETQTGAALLKLQFCVKARNFIRGEVAYKEGDPTTKLFFISEGEFELSKVIYTERKKNGMTEIYAVSNPDKEEKYQVEFNDPMDQETLKEYEGPLPKKKRFNKQSHKLLIITKKQVFGVIDCLNGMSQHMLTATCHSATALVYYITMEDFNKNINKYLAEKSINQYIVDRNKCVEQSLSDIMKAKMNMNKLKLKKLLSASNLNMKGRIRKRDFKLGESREKIISNVNRSRCSARMEGGCNSYEHESYLNAPNPPKYSKLESFTRSSQGIKAGNLSVEHEGRITRPQTRFNSLGKWKGNQNSNEDHWSHLQLSRNLGTQEQGHHPNIKENIKYTSHKVPRCSSVRRIRLNPFFRKYEGIMDKMKKDETFFITELQESYKSNMNVEETYIDPQLMESKSCSHLSRGDLTNINQHNILTNNTLDPSTKSTQTQYYGGIYNRNMRPPLPPKNRFKIGVLARTSPKLVSSKHNLFRLAKVPTTK